MEASDLGKRHDKIVILLWLYDCFVLDLCITTAANRSKNLLQLQDGPRLQGNLMKSQHVYGALAPSTCSRQASSPLVTLKFHRWLSHVAWSLGFDPQIGFPIQSGQDDRLCCLDLLIGLLKTNPNCRGLTYCNSRSLQMEYIDTNSIINVSLCNILIIYCNIMFIFKYFGTETLQLSSSLHRKATVLYLAIAVPKLVEWYCYLRVPTSTRMIYDSMTIKTRSQQV